MKEPAVNATPTPTALLIVDMQADFAEGGSLAVDGGLDLAQRLGRYARRHHDDYRVIVATRDWHPAGLAAHFATEPDYVDTWPAHCVQGTTGARFLPAVAALIDDGIVDVVVSKGLDSAAYSGFEGADVHGRTLHEILVEHRVGAVDVCGIATSHCVAATATQALELRYRVTVLADLAVGVTTEQAGVALAALAQRGITISPA